MSKSLLQRVSSAAVVFVIILITFSSCSEDIVLPPLDTLLGEYTGNYTLVDRTQGGSGVTRVDIDIDWVFTDIAYRLDDTTATICSPRGSYDLVSGDVVNLESGFDGVGTYGECDPTLNPVGNFSVRRPADSVILTQLENEIFIEIRLKKKGD